mgnify:CR=1 FL=1
MVVVEDTWGPPYPVESAKVYVGDYNSDTWHEIGTATNYNMKSTQTINWFRVVLPEDVEAKYVKVLDTSNRGDFIGVTPPDTVDGFDVNAIMAISTPIFDEENWNPGDKNISAYYVTNVGTKDIYVRAKYSGEWFEDEDGDGKWEKWNQPEGKNLPIIKVVGNEWVRKADDDYLYYTEILDGTYNAHEDRLNPTTELAFELDFNGPDADNDYQGKRFVLSVEFEAIQASHGASIAEWDWEPKKN